MKDLVHDKAAEKSDHAEEGRKGPGAWSRLKEKTSRALAVIAVSATLASCGEEFNANLPPIDGGVHDDGGTGGDGGMDGGMGGDGGMGDGGMDAGPTACLTVAPAAPWSGLIAAAGTKTLGGYDFTYIGPDGGGNAVMDVGCEGMLRFDNYAFPEDVVTTLNIAIDGRTIKVTPHSLNASQVNITLEVQ